METAVIILEVIASLAMIVLVLLQSGKEAGLSGALAGGSSDSYLSKNKQSGKDALYATCTKWVAVVWVLLTLSLSFF